MQKNTLKNFYAKQTILALTFITLTFITSYFFNRSTPAPNIAAEAYPLYIETVLPRSLFFFIWGLITIQLLLIISHRLAELIFYKAPLRKYLTLAYPIATLFVILGGTPAIISINVISGYIYKLIFTYLIALLGFFYFPKSDFGFVSWITLLSWATFAHCEFVRQLYYKAGLMPQPFIIIGAILVMVTTYLMSIVKVYGYQNLDQVSNHNSKVIRTKNNRFILRSLWQLYFIILFLGFVFVWASETIEKKKVVEKERNYLLMMELSQSEASTAN